MSGQELVVRVAALGAVAVVLNIPCGMWRAHLRKMTPKWWISLHMSIPAVITARRAMAVPKWAIALSIAGAVLGQQVGVKLERRRMARGKRGGKDAGSFGSKGASKETTSD